MDFFWLSQQHALALAASGDVAAADEALARLTERALSQDNPLRTGALYRDRAQVALYARDLPAFERHLSEMDRWFRRTNNPWLIQQHDGLSARATSLGVRAKVALDACPEADAMDGQTFVEKVQDVG